MAVNLNPANRPNARPSRLKAEQRLEKKCVYYYFIEM